MMCAWKQLLSVLPPRLRPEVDRLGKNALQELRLRLGMPPELVLSGESRWLGCCVSREDLNYCINAASRYSPWAAATTAQGYLTAPGGHRIGLCGEVVCKDGIVTGIREISSLCIRTPYPCAPVKSPGHDPPCRRCRFQRGSRCLTHPECTVSHVLWRNPPDNRIFSSYSGNRGEWRRFPQNNEKPQQAPDLPIVSFPYRHSFSLDGISYPYSTTGTIKSLSQSLTRKQQRLRENP